MALSIYLLALIAGFISFVSPCIVPMITVYFSVITGMPVDEIKRLKGLNRLRIHVLVSTILFIAGFTLIFTLAGGTSGAAGGLLVWYRWLLNIIGGIFVIFFALKMLGAFKIVVAGQPKWLNMMDADRLKTPCGYLTAFLVGIFFAVACSHCIGPILYSMLIFIGANGTTVNGMLTMFIFSIGLGIPYILVGMFMDRLLPLLKNITSGRTVVSIAFGIILLIFGILMVFNRFTLVVEFFYKIIPIKLPFGM